MRCLVYLSVAFTVSASSAQTLTPVGLAGKKVTALSMARTISPSANFLYAATSGEGVYRRAVAQSDSGWESLGLQNKELTALDVQVWGAGPAIFYSPLAGVAPDDNAGDSTLV